VRLCEVVSVAFTKMVNLMFIISTFLAELERTDGYVQAAR
jgi:hypothetical protein